MDTHLYTKITFKLADADFYKKEQEKHDHDPLEVPTRMSWDPERKKSSSTGGRCDRLNVSRKRSTTVALCMQIFICVQAFIRCSKGS